jgi:two-component system, NtrC family, response regulator AtoC
LSLTPFEARIAAPEPPDVTVDLELQALVDIYDQPFAIIGADRRVVIVNRAFEQAYGRPSEKAVGRRCHSLLYTGDRPCPCGIDGRACPFSEVFERAVTVTHEHTFEDSEGRVHNVRIQAYPLRARSGKVYLGELMQQDAIRLHPAQSEDEDPDRRLVGRSRAFGLLMDQLRVAARSEAPVLLHGQTGTGKELAAAYIHRHSGRQGGPFVTLDCTALSADLFESEVFGHERGAFTGSVAEKPGLFEMADGGTFFLDEIGEMALPLQAKLLRVLEEGEFRRVGSVKPRRANVRILCATNRQLRDATWFRQDLYYRIAGIGIRLPSLTDRSEDIPLLAEELLERIARATGRNYQLGSRALKVLQGYSYPGNVRELRNILSVASANSVDGVIRASHVTAALPTDAEGAESATGAEALPPPASATSCARSLTELEAIHLGKLMERHGGNRRSMARDLGVSVRTVYRKMKLYNLR